MGYEEEQFQKNRKTDTIYWVSTGIVGDMLFSFDKKKVYNLWSDYPAKLTEKEKEIFDKENPYWVEFFKPAKP